MSISKKNEHDVLIVGAGPTGLVAGIQFLLNGIQCKIIDKINSPNQQTKAMSISSSSMAVFKKLGVLTKFLELGNPISNVVTHYHGKRLSKINLNYLNKNNFFEENNFILTLPQPETEKILRERFLELGGNLEYGSNLDSFVQNNFYVDAKVRNKMNLIENYQTKFLLGCDGGRSTTRKELGISYSGDIYNVSFIYGDFLISYSGDKNSVHYFIEDDGFFAVVPMRNGWHRIFVQMKGSNPEKDYTNPSLSFFQNIISKRSKSDFKLLEGKDISYAKIYHLISEKIYEKRIFLSGDAFHLFSTIGGQGMNTGIQDAVNISWKLIYVLKGYADHSILCSYQKERLDIAKNQIQISDKFTYLMTRQNLENKEITQIQNNFYPKISNKLFFKNTHPFQISGHIIKYKKSDLIMHHEVDGIKTSQDQIYLGIHSGEIMKNIPLFNIKNQAVIGSKNCVTLKKHTFFIYIENFSKNLYYLKSKFIKNYLVTNDTKNIQKIDKIKTPEILFDFKKQMKNSFSFSKNSFILVRPDGYIEMVGNFDQHFRALKYYLKEKYISDIVYERNLF